MCWRHWKAWPAEQSQNLELKDYVMDAIAKHDLYKSGSHAKLSTKATYHKFGEPTAEIILVVICFRLTRTDILVTCKLCFVESSLQSHRYIFWKYLSKGFLSCSHLLWCTYFQAAVILHDFSCFHSWSVVKLEIWAWSWCVSHCPVILFSIDGAVIHIFRVMLDTVALLKGCMILQCKEVP